MPWATPQNMLDRVDNRWLCRFVKDDGTMATPLEFQASQRVSCCLTDAGGVILAYTLPARRYTKDDLNALTGDSLSLLVRMNADLASAFLAQSRQVPQEEIARTVPGYGLALKLLEMLNDGTLIFDKDAAAFAGLPTNQSYCASTVVTYARRYFGDAADTCRQPWWGIPCSQPPGRMGCGCTGA